MTYMYIPKITFLIGYELLNMCMGVWCASIYTSSSSVIYFNSIIIYDIELTIVSIIIDIYLLLNSQYSMIDYINKIVNLLIFRTSHKYGNYFIGMCFFLKFYVLNIFIEYWIFWLVNVHCRRREYCSCHNDFMWTNFGFYVNFKFEDRISVIYYTPSVPH